ncbi:hypothetical protein KVR01_012365 [Diaporthe batatas]|uniref:uncharacterized protein n=1 Tax=Diaporthe batatas TaxID=748121 RepID=UPI001D035EB1|nr:uncharacterized protein KVR01_012365 [Diaporthe batatas]KAG8157703.1 hypothetical protein KVR01_012365 [Diaporthe batatas]
MGSPHMLYVIAKINGLYRPLAVLWRSHDNKGVWAVETCRRLINIFQEPLNRALLLHELQLAGGLPSDKWEEPCREYPNERPAFPFIATCLLLGASVTPETGGGYNAIHEPFNIPLAAVSEGCTILDITNPAEVRYAFAFVPRPRCRSEVAVKVALGNTPLTAWEYASFYDDLSDHEDCASVDDDEVVSSTRARFIDTLRGQVATDATRITSPLIDEEALESAWPQPADGQSWKRRTDLGLAEFMIPPPSKSEPATSSHRQPSAHHVEALHEVFEQSYTLFQPGYNEGNDGEVSEPVPLVRQVANILHLGSLDDSSWQQRVADYEPKGRGSFRENAVQYFTFQLDDCPVTSGQTLDVIFSWMVAATAQEDLGGELQYEHYYNCTKPQSDQTLVKYFSLAGPNHWVVKPLPGRAFYYAKKSYHSSRDWTTAGLEGIREGEWTALLIQQWRGVRRHKGGMGILSLVTTDMDPFEFKCAFVTRGKDGEITAAGAETFRSANVPNPAHEALAKLDPGEETYGRQLTDILARGDANINGVPVSLMGRPEVLELLSAMEVVKAREDKLLASSWSKVHRGIMQRKARESDSVIT